MIGEGNDVDEDKYDTDYTNAGDDNIGIRRNRFNQHLCCCSANKRILSSRQKSSIKIIFLCLLLIHQTRFLSLPLAGLNLAL